MGKHREWASSPRFTDSWGDLHNPVHAPRDDTEIEKMMQEAPGQERPRSSLEATADLREVLADAVEALNDEERWIIERLFIEGLSLRATGRMMNIPKTTLARKRDKIRRRLILELTEDSHVKEWLGTKKES